MRSERVDFTAEALVVVAVACGPPPRRPSCRARARRVHSCYGRGLSERPLTGQMLPATVRTRRDGLAVDVVITTSVRVQKPLCAGSHTSAIIPE